MDPIKVQYWKCRNMNSKHDPNGYQHYHWIAPDQVTDEEKHSRFSYVFYRLGSVLH